MRYNIVKVLCKTTLALTIMLFGVKSSLAQGTVSLSEDIDSEVAVGATDELSLFNEDEDFSKGLLEPSAKTESSGSEYVETTTTTTVTTTSTDNAGKGTVSLGEDDIDLLEAYNKSPIGHSVNAAPVVIDDNFGEALLSQVDDKLFSQMSDIEKQTALLTLELRREKIKTEIDSIRIQRQKAIEEEEFSKELKAREKAQWENEQQRLLIVEQTKLQEENIKLEKLRQEKVINAYKNEMLKTNQKWVESIAKAYDATKTIEAERAELLKDVKDKLSTLSTSAQKIGTEAVTAKENYEREIQNLQTQISILNSRVETLNKERTDIQAGNRGGSGSNIDNPFASGGALGTSANPQLSLSEEYMVLEVRGKGETISAKISNKSGADAFFVKKGTHLKSGHVIEEITQTYIRADKGGEKDYLYFSAGGVLDNEPDSDIKIKYVPDDTTSTSGSSESSGGKKEKVTHVSDSFIEQMFAD